MNEGTLSSKQREVLDLLNAGKTPSGVATALDISVNGVYGHMKRIEQKGFEVPRSRQKPGRKPNQEQKDATPPDNGTVASAGGTEQEILSGIKGLVDRAAKRRSDIEQEVEEKTHARDTLIAEIDALRGEATKLAARQEGLEAATDTSV